VTNTLAYYGAELIAAAKSFLVQAAGGGCKRNKYEFHRKIE
jgi:hypothetical protein